MKFSNQSKIHLQKIPNRDIFKKEKKKANIMKHINILRRKIKVEKHTTRDKKEDAIENMWQCIYAILELIM